VYAETLSRLETRGIQTDDLEPADLEATDE